MQHVFNGRCSLLALSISAILFAAGPVRLQAQQDAGSAQLAGTVLDQAGKAIQNATVMVKNESSGFVRTVKTDADGRFSAVGMSSGSYTVEASASGFAVTRREAVQIATGRAEDIALALKIADLSQSVTVEAVVSLAAQASPSGNTLEARTAESVISPVFIQNFMSPVGDFSDVIQMSPGTFSVASNGPGLGDTKTFFRGFKDGFYNMTFDGLPFNDTNDPTHHSWVWFPSPFIGSTVFDRSPGDATSIGPSNSGGSINLLSRDFAADQNIRGTFSYGSFNTRLLELDYDSGAFGGAARKSSLFMDVHQVKSDGYQTFNFQDRWGGSAKYQYKFSDKTVLTAFTGIVDLASNTPNVKGPTRAQVAQFGDNYLLNNNPADPLYYRFSYYQIPTDFEYIGIKTELGHGWRLEDKVYTNRYYNHQQYNGSTITTTSGTDKLNSYRKFGDSLSASYDSKWGVLRTGLWYEVAYTDRFQIPTDPRTWVDVKTPNFHEKFITQSTQPFIQYELRATKRLTISAGFKVVNYNQHLNQFADNGKTIGCPGGVLSGGNCTGGFAFLTHTANYRSWQPSVAAHYRLKNNWSAYAQYATGNVIPPSSVFDVKNALVSVLPKPTGTKTVQVGSVWKNNRFSLDMDAYYIHAENPYTSAPDPVTGEPVYFLAGNTISKGFEAEGNAVIGHGFFLYLNGTVGNAKYSDTHLWVANSPHDTETVGLTYQRQNWDAGFFNKRVGQLYNDNGSTNQAVPIDPFNITNLFFNYTVKNASYLRGTKFRLGVNNLFDQHNIVGVTPASTKTSVPAPGDFLTLMAGRSVSFAVTFGYAPRR